MCPCPKPQSRESFQLSRCVWWILVHPCQDCTDHFLRLLHLAWFWRVDSSYRAAPTQPLAKSCIGLDGWEAMAIAVASRKSRWIWGGFVTLGCMQRRRNGALCIFCFESLGLSQCGQNMPKKCHDCSLQSLLSECGTQRLFQSLDCPCADFASHWY